MKGAVVWVEALTGLSGLRAPDGGSDVTDIKTILVVCGVSLLVWGMVLLRAARIQAGDGQGWMAFREWGGPVTLSLGALVLLSISDGGEVDRFLARAHWHLLERFEVVSAIGVDMVNSVFPCRTGGGKG
ncbi:hypothetical protein NPF39_002881 [Salmonella enterica subsp. enterica serovar Uganda]|nr:hypothetical protein [Salmonella enterica]EAC1542072.1 hypothetical protein [Salmonella enterica subsp. enterica]EBO2751029.1 hypothetical protein [Salmonella enterica subsp. enterica serovar Agona]EDE1788922.1 hypothetical protein [Salmonella enterica subsp. enterica serovar Enteritidis]EEJ6011819.1 hypothetical protein [Salmonella enterica subsp. enterica serovar Meleagridis]EGC3414673.1 hypothetical protein [Salmonella enterica subsp. enterica serovar Uganda]EIE4434102.1 hypothetical pr